MGAARRGCLAAALCAFMACGVAANTGCELLEVLLEAAAAPAPAPQAGAGPVAAPAPSPPAATGPSPDAADGRGRALQAPCELPACRSVDVQGAAGLVQAGHAFLDVRTTEEFAAGRPQGAVNVPIFLRQPGQEVPNTAFLEEVAALFPDPDTPVVVGCKTGRRSAAACQVLAAQGYTQLQTMEGGFEDWTAAGLPVEA